MCSPMNLELWRVFAHAARLGSFSKVAAARDTTQPHISRQINALERYYGGKLFERTGRGVALTAFGQRIEPSVRTWLNDTDQLDENVRSAAGQVQGQVRMGVIPSLAHPFMSTLFTQLRTRYPLIALSVFEGQGAQLEHQLEAGELDIAVLYRPRAAITKRSGQHTLFTSETYLVGPRGDRLTRPASVPFRALDDVPLVSFCRPSHLRDYLDALARKRRITLNVVLEADSLALQLGIVARGQAYALIGAYALRARKSEELQVAKIVEPNIERAVVIEFPRAGRITPAMRAVTELCVALAAKKADQLVVN
jgi:LysR family transcriptional regulator, nitrogen assimilation regulatory protein